MPRTPSIAHLAAHHRPPAAPLSRTRHPAHARPYSRTAAAAATARQRHSKTRIAGWTPAGRTQREVRLPLLPRFSPVLPPSIHPPADPFPLVQGQRSFHASSRQLAKNPYSVLGVGKDASTSEIKKAYYQVRCPPSPPFIFAEPERRLVDTVIPAARQEVPPRFEQRARRKGEVCRDPGGLRRESRFLVHTVAQSDTSASHAQTLSDDKKRADFDRFGSASQQPGFDSDAFARATSSFGGAGFGDFFGGGAAGASGADIFESLFGAFGRGGAAGPRQAQPVGDDIDVSISVPFIQAAKGTTKTIQISPVVDCHTCHGSGLKEGMKKTTCASCGGTGTRTFTIQSGFQMASTCAACGGSGTVAPPGSNCGTCAGVGKVRERRSVEVKIPPGVDDGMRIRLDGKGDAPLGGKGRNGDLFVRISVQPSKVFARQGANLYETVSVPFYTAILGGRAPVKTLDRDVEVKVPQGTQPGEEMVLRGRGVKKLYKEEYGDLIVRFNVSMPRCVTLLPVARSPRARD